MSTSLKCGLMKKSSATKRKLCKCMVCGHRMKATSEFSRRTGFGVCKDRACRNAFAEAGIV